MTHQDTIIFLHGFTGSNADWSDTVTTLAPQYTAIMPDISGHGNAQISADSKDYRMEIVAEQILSLTDSPFHLVGYSMGGRLALYLATYYPDRVLSLTLESASPGLKTDSEREARRLSDNALADKIEKNGIAWFVDFWENLSLWDSQSPELKAQLRENRLKNKPIGLANSLRGMGTGVMPSLWDKLVDLPMSVQLIAGEYDTKFVAINREMLKFISDARLDIVPSAGHTVHLEQSEAFKDILLNFLNQHKST